MDIPFAAMELNKVNDFSSLIEANISKTDIDLTFFLFIPFLHIQFFLLTLKNMAFHSYA